MLGYNEPPISIQTIYDYEVELPLRIAELYGKQAFFSFSPHSLICVQVQRQRTKAATTPQAFWVMLTDTWLCLLNWKTRVATHYLSKKKNDAGVKERAKAEAQELLAFKNTKCFCSKGFLDHDPQIISDDQQPPTTGINQKANPKEDHHMQKQKELIGTELDYLCA